MSDTASLDRPSPQSSDESPSAKPELPPWLRKLLFGLGVSGPFIGWFIGFVTTPEDANPVDLVREVLQAVTGPFGATILAVLAAGGLAWHHVRTLNQHERERKDRSGATARVADRGEQRVAEKDQKLEEAHEKTLGIFRTTVTNYERALSEMNARTDTQTQQLLHLREELQAMKVMLQRLSR